MTDGWTRTLSLVEVARRSGLPVRQLREWCATGRLACDRDGGAWCLDESELPKVAALSSLGHQLAQRPRDDGRVPFGAAFRDSVAAREALQELRRDATSPLSEVSVAPLAIDGMTLVLLAGWLPASATATVEEVVERRGGWFLDGIDTAGDALRDMPVRELEQGQSA